MKRININHPSITERIAKCFVGDEQQRVPYPYRSGSQLVKFFNSMGYTDKYGNGFPTRWVYAEGRIKEFIQANRFEEFLQNSISIEELIKFYDDGQENIQAIQAKIIKGLNDYICKLTDYEVITVAGSIRLKRVEELERIGGGYFSNVYLLNEGDKKYAIKRLKEEFIADEEQVHRFKREYEIMFDLNNCGHTIKVFEFDNQNYSFKMEYADDSLKDYIEKNYHVMNLAWKESICEQIIVAMKELHKTTIHRDLSYNNILMVANVPKLADFGLGKDINKLYSYRTVSQQLVGTPHFTDPIQKQNLKHASIQTDIYSLGMIIDYVFCGSIVSERHKYSSIVFNATNKDLNQRYKSVDELHQAFIKIKNSGVGFDPVQDLIDMFESRSISTEKVYNYIIRRDSGNILWYLILKNRAAAKEILSIIAIQYEHELERLLKKLHSEIESNRLNYQQYDRFGYVAMDLLIEIDENHPAGEVLAEIINYCAIVINRFNIQKLIEKNRNNNKIPYSIRQRWNEQ